MLKQKLGGLWDPLTWRLLCQWLIGNHWRVIKMLWFKERTGVVVDRYLASVSTSLIYLLELLLSWHPNAPAVCDDKERLSSLTSHLQGISSFQLSFSVRRTPLRWKRHEGSRGAALLPGTPPGQDVQQKQHQIQPPADRASRHWSICSPNWITVLQIETAVLPICVSS